MSAPPPTIDRLFAAMDATWPALSARQAGGWLVRAGGGGGSRVSSATVMADEAQALDTIGRAEEAHETFGQRPLFRVTPEQVATDAALAARGYGIADPTILRAGPITALTGAAPPPVTCFPSWPPLAICTDIWDAGHIGPERRGIMARVQGPKLAILGRTDDRAAGALFVAVADGVGYVHALHVDPAFRRRGLARNLMLGAGRWAADQGAQHMALAVTRANVAANALYESLGLVPVSAYHYRAIPA